MNNQKDRIESAIRHIQTAADVDPWAMELAVDALKEQGTCEDAVSRQTLQKELALYPIDDVTSEDEAGYNRAINDVQKMVLHLPSAQPEKAQLSGENATFDCISRQTVIDAIDDIESEVADGDGFQYAKWREYFCDLPSEQPQSTMGQVNDTAQSTNDCISRQTAIELIERMKPYHQGADDIAEMIANMPSAQPETNCSEFPNNSDTISRQAAIDALGEEPEVWSGKDEYEQGLNNQWHYDVNALKALSSAQPEEDCDTCKHGYFGDDQCNNCRVRYPSHYERRTDENR